MFNFNTYIMCVTCIFEINCSQLDSIFIYLSTLLAVNDHANFEIGENKTKQLLDVFESSD